MNERDHRGAMTSWVLTMAGPGPAALDPRIDALVDEAAAIELTLLAVRPTAGPETGALIDAAIAGLDESIALARALAATPRDGAPNALDESALWNNLRECNEVATAIHRRVAGQTRSDGR